MEWILTMIGVIALIAIVVTLAMYFVLGKSTQISRSSKYILYRFEPDNTAPKITELIEFHKVHEKVKYNID